LLNLPRSAARVSPGTLGRRTRWYPELPNQENDMDKDRIKGSAEQAKGKVKEWAGKITGDSKTEAEGKADQVKGKVQNMIGGIKDTVRGE
jgi:uncharacterized protein YjbJ (UPF0337 family)